MLSIAHLAAAATAALAIGGTGSAALVMNAPPSKAEVATELTVKASADLSGAEKAHQLAVDALSSATAEGKAEAQAQLDVATARLEKASDQMEAAVKTGSKVALDALSQFTATSVRLVNAIATTTSATAQSTIKTGTGLINAVDTQLATARGIATSQGTAAVQALSQVRSELPKTIAGLVEVGTSATPSVAVPAVPSAEVIAGGQASTALAGLPVGVVTDTVASLGINLGR
jgi:hypothetical protein